jgi:ferrous iron transport protein A
MDSCVAWHAVDMGVGTALEVRSLASLHKGDRGIVSALPLDAGQAVAIGDSAGSTLARRLLEVGFVPGERIEVIEEIRPGGDPLAVRIGSSIFALRRREALGVMVQLERPLERAEGV